MNKTLIIGAIIIIALADYIGSQGTTEIPEEYAEATNDTNPYFSGYGTTSNSLFSYRYPGYQENNYWSINNWPPEISEATKEECRIGTEGSSIFDVVTGYQGEYCVTIITTEENGETVQTYALRGQSAEGVYVELSNPTVMLKDCDTMGDRKEACLQAQFQVAPEQFIEILMGILDSAEQQ